MAEFFFWLFLVLIIYLLIGYFSILKFINFIEGKHKQQNRKEEEFYPPVTIIMLALNEDDKIRKWFHNIENIDYPREKLQIIMASDGSCDRTVEEAVQFQSDNTIIIDFPESRGRALCHNDTIEAAKNEIIITTDADTEFSPDTIKMLVRHMKDPGVGAVIGRLNYRENDGSTSSFERRYLKFETALKEQESSLGILSVGMGCCFCIRKSLFSPLNAEQDIDNVYPLLAVKKGYRIVFEPNAPVTDSSPSNIKSEFSARIRIASRSLKDNLKSWDLKDCFRHPAITWGIISHRILRWMIPFLMTGVLASNLFLIDMGIYYLWFFKIQVVFYVLVLIGWIASLFHKHIPVASQAYVFIVANIGIGIGVMKAIFDKPPATYIPAE